MTATTADLAQRTLGITESREIVRRIGEGAHATIGANTRSRQLTALAGVTREGFKLLLPSDGRWRMISGPADRLGGELVGLVTTLERLTGTALTTAPPPAVDIPPLAPGELLALAEVIRQGDGERLEAALDELELAGMPWWVTQFAWGAEAVLTLRLTGEGIAGFATMLHLMPGGWGCLQADPEDDLTFHPMTTIEVQARVSAFADLLQECSW
ncbi:hypothetical protein [Flexivirga alba]|uniref:Uncharacterized protein n=1 Tax=Flexivirga alba TaxID=702742 RepID=A0ABW2AE05_9MICO